MSKNPMAASPKGTMSFDDLMPFDTLPAHSSAQTPPQPYYPPQGGSGGAVAQHALSFDDLALQSFPALATGGVRKGQSPKRKQVEGGGCGDGAPQLRSLEASQTLNDMTLEVVVDFILGDGFSAKALGEAAAELEEKRAVKGDDDEEDPDIPMI